MIPKETITRIMEAARIEEVVGEFVNLKKSGQSLKGLSPFTDERNPSFYVSPAKNIYKCFSSGKGGNAVNFIMEHEHFTYPEALRYLAKKYDIEIEEKEPTPEELEAQNEQESLYHLSAFAQKYFSDLLFNHDKGKAIGLEYYKNREFREETIRKFELGYCLEEWEAFTQEALKSGYKPGFLVKSGLTISKDDKKYDRFRGRMMFPIHNLSGRVIGFGGRTLKSDEKVPKYVNSPESAIYNKSKVLYGLYYAKGAVIRHDNCYLVEGYTDVISLFQAGIENVVSSSGTALTTDQIRLIKRYTPNITILYDGDPAGIKASFRGIDMILEEGMSVRIVLFPEGEDPDSYARKYRRKELEELITNQAVDFIRFKTGLLQEEAAGDPIKTASLIKEIVNSIALIPDTIYRSVYVKECSNLLDVPERALINELNKILRRQFRKKATAPEPLPLPDVVDYTAEKQVEADPFDTRYQERDIIRLLIMYGNNEIIFYEDDEQGLPEAHPVEVARFIVDEIARDEIVFQDPTFQRIFNICSEGIDHGHILDEQHFINNEDQSLVSITIDLISSPYELSENWSKNKITVTTERDKLKESVFNTVLSFKAKTVEGQIAENQKKLKRSKDTEEIIQLLARSKKLKDIHKEINNQLGRVILR